MIPCKTKGFICGMVAAMTYGMNPLFALPLYKEGLNADSVLFYRYGLAIVFLGLLMKWAAYRSCPSRPRISSR